MRSWDCLAIGAWGVLLLKYWLTGQLAVLIHPNYFPLTVGAGLLLLGLSLWQGWQLGRAPVLPETHILLPRSWSRFLLLSTAVVGLLVTPQPFNSQVALESGELLTLTRTMPQRFRPRQRPEDRSLVDWVRLLQLNPEPDAYQGQRARVEGFVVHLPESPPQRFFLTRFVVTCCAADAYPVGLPVDLPTGKAQQYPADTWLRVEGRMTTGEVHGKRRLVVQAERVTPIARPANPYVY